MALADHAEQAARTKLGDSLPATYTPCAWDARSSTGYVKLTFVRCGTDAEGRTIYDSSVKIRVKVSASEIAKAEREFVAMSGKCPECMGSCRELERWSSTDGATYRPCAKCSGSGLAREETT